VGFVTGEEREWGESLKGYWRLKGELSVKKSGSAGGGEDNLRRLKGGAIRGWSFSIIAGDSTGVCGGISLTSGVASGRAMERKLGEGCMQEKV